MQLSELKLDVDFLCGSTSATYPNTDKVRNMNIAYQQVAALIWESQTGWQYDDSNASTFAIATASLVAGQQDYELPSTAQRILRVEAKDSSGNFQRLERLDQHDVYGALSEFHETDGNPLYYDMIGRSVMLYPASDSTISAGLKVYFNRDVTNLVASATTTTPGFALPYHRILSISAAIDFLDSDEEINRLLRERSRLEKGLTRFYARREEEGPAKIKPAGRKRWRKYV